MQLKKPMTYNGRCFEAPLVIENYFNLIILEQGVTP
jgi:hypothetical protein